MAGRLRDPLVGKAILVGVAGGVAAQLMGSIWLVFGISRQISLAAAALLDVSSGPFPLRPLLGPHVALGQICRELMISMVCGFVATLLFLYVLRMVLRKECLAYVAFVSFFAVPSMAKGDYVAACTVSLWMILAIVLLFRFGVLAVVVAWVAWQILAWPITMHATAPYVDRGLTGHLLVLGLASYGLFTVNRSKPTSHRNTYAQNLA